MSRNRNFYLGKALRVSFFALMGICILLSAVLSLRTVAPVMPTHADAVSDSGSTTTFTKYDFNTSHSIPCTAQSNWAWGDSSTSFPTEDPKEKVFNHEPVAISSDSALTGKTNGIYKSSLFGWGDKTRQNFGSAAYGMVGIHASSTGGDASHTNTLKKTMTVPKGTKSITVSAYMFVGSHNTKDVAHSAEISFTVSSATTGTSVSSGAVSVSSSSASQSTNKTTKSVTLNMGNMTADVKDVVMTVTLKFNTSDKSGYGEYADALALIGNVKVTVNPQYYTVNIDKNGGSGDILYKFAGSNDTGVASSSMSLIYGYTYNLYYFNSSITRPGYRYSGINISGVTSGTSYWGYFGDNSTGADNVLSNNVDIAFDGGDLNFYNLNSTNGATVTIKLLWTPITYNVSVDYNGGSAKADTSGVVYKVAGSSNSPSIAGAEPLTYDVVYNIYHFDDYTTRTGYLYDGIKVSGADTSTAKWGLFTDNNTNATSSLSNGTVIATSDGDLNFKNLTTTDGATITIQIQWKPITYSVNVDYNGGSSKNGGIIHKIAGSDGSGTAIGGASLSYDSVYNIYHFDDCSTRTGYLYNGIKVSGADTSTAKWGLFTDNNTNATSSLSNGTVIATSDGDINFKNLATVNGAEVTVQIQWKPITYNVTVDVNGGVGSINYCVAGDSSSANRGNNFSLTYDTVYNLYTFGSDIARAGYTYDGIKVQNADSTARWDYGAGTTATTPIATDSFGADNGSLNLTNLSSTNGASVTVQVQWRANTDTQYTVEHYFENVANDYYSLDSTRTQYLKGTTDTTANASYLTVAGFVNDADNAERVESGNIAGNGSLVLRLYYDRTLHTVAWTNYDGASLENDVDVKYGATPSYDGVTPTRDKDAQYTYTHSGWTPAVTTVSGDVTYVATYSTTVNKYTVTWINHDGATLETDVGVPYGDTPSYDGATPTKTRTDKYSYTFAGWDNEVIAVVGNATYKATFSDSINEYTITWVNHDDSTLYSEEVKYGDTPVYVGDTPTRTATAQYTYTFSGWSPEVSLVTGATTYVAQFSATTNRYTVTWINHDDTVLETDVGVFYGSTPSYDGATPTKAGNAEFSYNFSSWTPVVSTVVGNATYKATYSQSTNTYTVTWKNSDLDGTVLETDVDVLYGAVPTYDGATPTRDKDAQYTYTFASWDQGISAVVGDVTYTAVYDTTINKYTVTWVNYDNTTLETDTNVPYGTTPEYNGTEPTRPSTAENNYTFTGWDPIITAVSGNITYTAAYATAGQTYTITWVNHDGTVLETDVVEYNETPVYNGSTPIKDKDVQYTYTFAGWNHTVIPAVRNQEYKAVYDETVNKYLITWVNHDDSTLYSAEVEYGSVPTYGGDTPTKNRDQQYTYTFYGWDVTPTAVVGATTYKATFSHVTNKYAISWVDEDGATVLYSTEVEYGSVPVYGGDTPTKAMDVQYIYTFDKWAPNVVEVTDDATYTATYSSTLREYPVYWYDEDGDILETDEKVPYGTVPTYDGATPTKAGDAQYHYDFVGWSPSVTAVVGKSFYTATYERLVNTYKVTWVNYDGTELEVDAAVPYGEKPVYNGATPARVATDQYTFVFKSWDKTIVNVTEDTTYKATFTNVINKYTYQFVSDGKVVSTAKINYGTIIPAPANPTKEADETYEYTFESWEGYVKNMVITSDVTFTAVYSADYLSYDIIFVANGEVFERQNYHYGETVVPPVGTPTKPSTQEFSYLFREWLPTFEPVTRDAMYEAFFDAVTNKYEYVFYDEDGTELKRETVDYGSAILPPAEPTKATTTEYIYTFSGWYTDEGALFLPADLLYGDMSYYAGYSAKKVEYTIYFDTDGGSELSPITLEWGAVIPTLPTPDKTGYSFSSYDMEIPEVMPKQDFTLVSLYTLLAPTLASVGYSGIYDGVGHGITLDITHPLMDELTFTYQWYRGSIAPENIINGADEIVYSVKNFADSDSYFCHVEATLGSYSSSADSEAVVADIARREVAVSVVDVEIGTYVYDGAEKYTTATYDTAILYNGDVIEYELSYVDNVNAGNCEVSITSAILIGEEDNYTLDYTDIGYLFIEQATYSVGHLVFDSVSTVYDGKMHFVKVEGALPEGLKVVYDGPNYCADYTAEPMTVTAKFIGDENYYPVPDMTTTITIAKKELTVDFAESPTVTYDGLIHGVELTFSGLVEADEGDITVVPYCEEIVRNAGTYVITAAFDGGDGHNYSLVGETSTTLTITKLSATITALNSSSVYGRSLDLDFTNFSSEGFLEGEVPTIEIIKEEGEDIGEYVITPYTDSINYDITFIDGIHTITPRPIGIFILDQKQTEEGSVEINQNLSPDGKNGGWMVQTGTIVGDDDLNIVLTVEVDLDDEKVITGIIIPSYENPNYKVTFLGNGFDSGRNIAVGIFEKMAYRGTLIIDEDFVNTKIYDGKAISIPVINTANGPISFYHNGRKVPNSFLKPGHYFITVSGESGSEEVYAPYDVIVEIIIKMDSVVTNSNGIHMEITDKDGFSPDTRVTITNDTESVEEIKSLLPDSKKIEEFHLINSEGNLFGQMTLSVDGDYKDGDEVTLCLLVNGEYRLEKYTVENGSIVLDGIEDIEGFGFVADNNMMALIIIAVAVVVLLVIIFVVAIPHIR